jgi:hypothetical protein
MAIEELQRAVRTAKTAVQDELAEAPTERRYPELVDAAGDLRRALTDVIHAVRTSTRRLEFRDLVADALDAGQIALLEAAEDADALRSLDLEQEVADLYVLDARLQVAVRLREVAAHESVERTGLKKAYVSELRNMSKRNGGLPSADAALRIDQALGLGEADSLAALVRTTKAERVRLREQRRKWLAETATPAPTVYDPAVDRRVQAIAEAARRDDVVARTAELLVSVGDRERRAVLRLLEELARG